MRAVVGLVLWVLVAAGCSRRNEEYCGDGACIDPALRYCDVDGMFGGVPGTCIAVDCTSGEFVACRNADTALACASTGNDYEVTQCPLGCDDAAHGCKECTSNVQCSAELVCDRVSSRCRACKRDDECDSKVCDVAAGACIPETSVVYASGTAISGACTLAQPCSLADVVPIATNAPVTPVVRLLPGTYTTTLKVDNPTAKPLQVVATDANIVVIGDVAAVVVNRGATVSIRNLTSTSQRHVQCGATGQPLSMLEIRDSLLTSVGVGTRIETERCTLRMSSVKLSAGDGTPIGTRDDSTIEADRFHMAPSSELIAAGGNVRMHFTNSLLEAGLFAGLSDVPSSSLRFSNVTMVLRGSRLLFCQEPSASQISVLFENSIIAASGALDALASPTASHCRFTNTMLTKQTTPPPGTFVNDPQFVDVVQRNFHVKSTSPAVDAAVSASVNPDHDLDGFVRPTGAGADVGAYEYHP